MADGICQCGSWGTLRGKTLNSRKEPEKNKKKKKKLGTTNCTKIIPMKLCARGSAFRLPCVLVLVCLV